jgi:hypothetical protein
MHLPGGIISVYSRCATPTDYQFSFQGTTLGEELNYIASVDASRHWTFQDGLILVGSDLLPRTILNTTIADIDIRSDDALSLSTEHLLQSPEVRDAVKASGLMEGINRLPGFAAIHNPNTQTSANPEPIIKHLHQVTLGNALGVLAAMKGQGVWHYEQFECGSTSTYRIEIGRAHV